MDPYNSLVVSVRTHRLIAGGDRVLAAVSGGPDSTALLHLLLRYRRDHPFELAVAHLDHAVRGDAGASDRRFVEEMAAAAGLPCFAARLEPESASPVPATPRRSGQADAEQRLRARRHAFLRQVAHDWRATRLALGHTRDDQAETFLLHLLRGTGSRGLGGMRPLDPGDPIVIRPLLDVPRAELLRLLESVGQAWREDESNRAPRWLRNRVRHELLPLLEDLRPGATGTVARASTLLRDEQDWMERVAGEVLTHLLPADGTPRLPVAALSRLDPALARRVLRRAAARTDASATPPARGAPLPWRPGATQINALLALLQRPSGEVSLGGGRVARRRGEWLEFGLAAAPE